jgi:multisubunit Na+/H+ antiporter MnhG subunit
MNRIKNWITTTLGAILFIFGIISFWFEKGDWWSTTIFAVLGVFFIYSEDTLIEKLTFGIFKVKKNGN